MCWYFSNPLNSAVLHLRIRVKPLSDGFGNDRPLVLFQRINLGLNIGGQCVNLGTFGVKEVSNALLFFYRGNNYRNCSQLIFC